MMKQYPYPLTITLAHMIANSILIYPVLMVAGLSHQTKTPHSLFLRFLLPLGIGKLLSSVAAHVSIWKVSISYAHTVKATMPIFTVILTRIMFREKHSKLVYLSLLPIIIGVAVATVTELNFELSGMASAFIGTAIFALQNVFSKSALRELKLNPLQLLSRMAQIALTICIPLWVLVDMPVMQHDINLTTGTEKMGLLGKLVLVGCINFMQNIMAFSVLHLLSPLSYSVTNATKRILVISISIITMKNPVTIVNFMGMMTAVSGVFLYSRAKALQNERSKKILPTTNTDVEDFKYSLLPRHRMYNSKHNSFI